MIGKASEINFDHINVKENELQGWLRLWKRSHQNAEIIDIKLTSVISQNSVIYNNALIIYKEGSL